MSKKERSRLVVVSRVKEKQMTIKEASELLGISYRQCQRIYKRYVEEGDKGLLHRNRGRPSNRKKPAEVTEMSQEETTVAAMRVLWVWVERYGIPKALYVDWKIVSQSNLPPAKRRVTVQEHLDGSIHMVYPAIYTEERASIDMITLWQYDISNESNYRTFLKSLDILCHLTAGDEPALFLVFNLPGVIVKYPPRRYNIWREYREVIRCPK